MMPLIFGLAGGTCCGKSTLSLRVRELLRPIASAAICFDSYYRPLDHLPAPERSQVNFDHPDSLEVELFVDHLRALKEGRAVEQPVYDFACHTRAEVARVVEPGPVVIADGILLLAFPEVRALLDHSLYLDLAEEQRLARRIARDGLHRGRSEASVRRQFEATVRPMHNRFVQPSRVHADQIVEGTMELEALARSVAEDLRTRLAGQSLLMTSE
ncbi:MAG: uridine kinase [Myxococcota bacterium]|nr:uridine kinase [Myxococcota bacterium]